MSSSSSSSPSSSSSSLNCARLTTWIIVAVLLQIFGLTLFVLGFFPVKPALSGVSGPESYRTPISQSMEDHQEINQLAPDQLRSLYTEMSEIPPSFDRLILMVVDGLPAEFVLGKLDQPPNKAMMEAMPYTQSLLSNGTAIGYHAKAAPPTVTMPRLKAMVSGAIGGFLDVAFNFNTQALLDDNLLGQFYRIGWKMVMLGDETWIKLFPRLFTRHDGVSSFYVKDTVEVDQNVSRHLGPELMANDWNLLILHYLGLDHVGHIGGRGSVLMIPKLNEMDEVIKTIHMNSVLHQDHGRTLLLVVSDHGMTENGNHGGSSYEETDSLALFIGLGSKIPYHASATPNAAFQVDITPTLALLFGVPIPKNNIGVMLAEAFESLTDGQRLRALELNSWQLFRLLQAQLPGLVCGNFSCSDFDDEQCTETNACKVSIEQKFCCLYAKATTLHSSWASQKDRRSRSNIVNFRSIVAAYNNFLKTASEWLSHRVTDKPPELLAPGIAMMVISCSILLGILFRSHKGLDRLASDSCNYKWNLHEGFTSSVIVVLVVSMGSSSMVEEEQYIWHFLTSTLYLIFLRKTIQSPSAEIAPNLLSVTPRHILSKKSRTCSIILVLICGRILRGWHQGGVNWVHLTDISKWLEQTSPHIIRSIQIVVVLLVIIVSSFALYLLNFKTRFIRVLHISLFISGLLVLIHIMECQFQTFIPSNYSSTLLAQIIFATLGTKVMVAIFGAPWTIPISVSETHEKMNINFKSDLLQLRYSLFVIGWACTACWCLLQLLLQQPINAVPVLLLYLQILGSVLYFSVGEINDKQWVEVAALYFLGMAGHFGLGNSNTLATIDVAGAFVGISSHSTLLSGVLMFIITLASPLLFFLSMIIYISVKDATHLTSSQNIGFGDLLRTMIFFPCIVPLALNSVILTAFTIVLVFMRNHLFVWSVFSPKYLYVVATTISVYAGVFLIASTGAYACLVFLRKGRMLGSKGSDTNNKKLI